MKNTLKISFFAIILVAAGLLAANAALACPSNTQVGETQANLVGEITNTGGDNNLEVWFQYGQTSSYGLETSHQSQNGTGLFCINVYSLTPCTTYHYRAIGRNSGGTTFGGDQSFTTTCSAPTVDLKANSSNGPITLSYQDYVTLSWAASNANSCSASGDWSGSKPTSGSQSVQMTSVKTYTFTLTCQSSGGQSSNDSVQVIVNATPPGVITKPAVVTL